jgi:uncharacterized membrane protein YjgN (DUF898 family)
MLRDGPTADSAAAKTSYAFEFRGTGGEYFRIWIVNLALTIITLGVYGAWAKVRTYRYFRGSTFLAGHPFDYHASPVRILIGRLIAVTVLLGYGLSARIHPLVALGWGLLFLFITPWLVVSSLRFNARNTSYRNVRFNFVGTMAHAARVYILYPFLAVFTLFLAWPLVHRARDYFIVNSHTFGGKHFSTRFSIGSIYGVYIAAIGIFIGALVALFACALALLVIAGVVAHQAGLPVNLKPDDLRHSPFAAGVGVIGILIIAAFYLTILFIATVVQTYIRAKTMNLSLDNATLEGGHELRSELEFMPMAWIMFTNALLVLVTIGIYYPWAVVRLTRYELSCFGLIAASNLDEFTSEAMATQSAIGEEIASFFDLGISL